MFVVNGKRKRVDGSLMVGRFVQVVVVVISSESLWASWFLFQTLQKTTGKGFEGIE